MTPIPGMVWLAVDELPARFTNVWITADDTLYVAVPAWVLVVLLARLVWDCWVVALVEVALRFEYAARCEALQARRERKVVQLSMFKKVA